MTDDWHQALSTCDAFVHLAAHGVNPAEENWEKCFKYNVNDSISLWNRAYQAGIRQFTICGSCFEYGNAGEKYEWIPVTAPLEPTGAYSSSKAAASMLAYGMAVDLKLRLAIVRPFHVFGEGESTSRLWPSLRSAALAGDDLQMTAGEQIRDFLPVENLATTLLKTVEQPQEAGEPLIINAGSGHPSTIRNFAEHWWTHWNASGKLLVGALPYRKNEVMRYVPEINFDQ